MEYIVHQCSISPLLQGPPRNLVTLSSILEIRKFSLLKKKFFINKKNKHENINTMKIPIDESSNLWYIVVCKNKHPL